MAVFRRHKADNYTVVSNTIFKEQGLSFKAKGLHATMMTLPDDWDYSIVGLATLSSDKESSVRTALIELETFGYLKRTRIADEHGKFVDVVYDIYEEPQTEDALPEENPHEEKPQVENPHVENPHVENRRQLNTKELNTKESKNIGLEIIGCAPDGDTTPQPTEDKPSRQKKFKPPTLEEVRAYIRERGSDVDAERFIDYYESVGWKVGRNPMKDWRAAVRTWERRRSEYGTDNGAGGNQQSRLRSNNVSSTRRDEEVESGFIPMV